MKEVIVGIIAAMFLMVALISVAEIDPLNNKKNEILFENELIAHWDFNEMKGTVIYDQSENGFHGKLFGNPTWTQGKIDGALAFDADDDYISIMENTTTLFSMLSHLGQGSISVWFRVDSIPVEDGIMPIFYYGSEDPCENFFDAANQGLIIEVGHSPIHYASKRIYFTIWANGCTYPSFCFDSRDPLTEGVWYHVVAVVGPNYNTGYLNGEELIHRRYNFGNSHDSQFFEDAVVDEAMWFGRGYWNARKDPSPVYFDGVIDDIRIFSKPLSDDEIQDIYLEGSDNNPPETPLITGPTNGKVGENYEYVISAVDPDGDAVYYTIDWSKGSSGNHWYGPYESAKEITFNHSWNKSGDYLIHVTAKDEHNLTSSTATLQVRMPKINPRIRCIEIIEKYFSIHLH